MVESTPTNKSFDKTHFISLPKTDLVFLKQIELKIIRLLNENKARCCWDELNEILTDVRNVGAFCKECNLVGECENGRRD